MRTTLVMAFLVSTLAGCSSDPADVAGDYSIAVTNRENGCQFDNWTEGETSNNIPAVVTQDGESVTVTVNGGAGLVFDIWLGSRNFEGTVDGDDIDATIYGGNTFDEGNCAYSFNAVLDANVAGDFMSGDIRYTAKTNGNPDCAPFDGCVTRQQFNGNRPPQ